MVKLSFKTLLWWNLKGNFCRDFRSKDSKLLWKNSNLAKNDRRLSTNLQECPWLNSVWGAGDEKPFKTDSEDKRMKIRMKNKDMILWGCDGFDLQWFSRCCWARHRPNHRSQCVVTLVLGGGREGDVSLRSSLLSCLRHSVEELWCLRWGWVLGVELDAAGVSGGRSVTTAITAAAGPAVCNVAGLYSRGGTAPSPGRRGWWTRRKSAPSCWSWNAPPASTDTTETKYETNTSNDLSPSHKSLIICLNVSPRSCVYMFWWCSINNWVPSQDQTSALSRLPAEALCWTDSRTLVKYESFTPKHVNVGPGLKIQEFTFKLCTTSSTYTLR